MIENVISLVITIVAIAIAVHFVLKKHNPSMIFFGLGLVLLLILTYWKGANLMGDATTGNKLTDIFAVVTKITKGQLGGVGANLMMVAGYAALMSYIGASDKLALTLTRPLSKLGVPYLVMALLFVVGAILKLMITSHAGLVLLLMATFFPVLIRLGVDRLSATAAIFLTGAIDWGTNDGAVLFAAEKVAGMTTVEYFTKHQWLPAVIYIAVMAVTMYFFYSKYGKKTIAAEESKEMTPAQIKAKQEADAKEKEANEHADQLPSYYAIFPAVPLLFVVFFQLFTKLKVDIFTANVIAAVLVFVAKAIRIRNGRKIGDELKELFRAMGASFANVVSLIIAAGVFAEGLIGLGGIGFIFDALSNIQGAAVISIILLTALTFFATVILGSGNASWFAFGLLVPDIATKLGLQAYQISVPMQLAASTGRGLSPVAAAMIAAAGLGEVTIDDLIKHCALPVIAGTVAMLLASLLFLL